MANKENGRRFTAFMTSSGFAGVRHWDHENQKTEKQVANAEELIAKVSTEPVIEPECV